jgi:hypothetical protein
MKKDKEICGMCKEKMAVWIYKYLAQESHNPLGCG